MSARRWLWITLFGVAMGFLEAAVVVYLRLVYYPGGFGFPLVMIPGPIAAVEIAREAATLVMLAAVAVLAGRTGREKFAWFCLLFGTWDIVYYVGLKLVLDWPASFLAWDVLFLIPLIWTGPVLAPLIVSLLLVAAGVAMLHDEGRRVHVHLTRLDRLLLGASLLLQLYAFMANHPAAAGGRMPGPFPWAVFLSGMAIGVAIGVRARLVNPRSVIPRRYGLR